MRTGVWTDLLAGALAHDIGNLAHGLATAQRLTGAGAGEDFDVAEWAAFVERDVDRLRTLGIRLRALAAAGDRQSSVRLEDACARALAEVGAGGRVRRAVSAARDARARGAAAAVSTAIVSLLEHALAASATGAPIELAVRDAGGGGAVAVEIAAPAASALGAIARARLDTLLDGELRDRRGDLSLVLAGAVADALGGAVHVTSDPKRGLTLELQLVAAPA